MNENAWGVLHRHGAWGQEAARGMKYTAVNSYYHTELYIYFDTSLTFPKRLAEASAAAAWLHAHRLVKHDWEKHFKALFDHISPQNCPSFPLATVVNFL